jgi:hypothetical protein
MHFVGEEKGALTAEFFTAKFGQFARRNVVATKGRKVFVMQLTPNCVEKIESGSFRVGLKLGIFLRAFCDGVPPKSESYVYPAYSTIPFLSIN